MGHSGHPGGGAVAVGTGRFPEKRRKRYPDPNAETDSDQNAETDLGYDGLTGKGLKDPEEGLTVDPGSIDNAGTSGSMSAGRTSNLADNLSVVSIDLRKPRMVLGSFVFSHGARNLLWRRGYGDGVWAGCREISGTFLVFRSESAICDGRRRRCGRGGHARKKRHLESP